ncbi:ribonuclease R [Flavobacteriaceae bacterium]|nr:ribonuclease R [Flavobacteriaceae bacterium]MDC1459134.1 ribonuclease R [Flavobacteriaceae bacterium]
MSKKKTSSYNTSIINVFKNISNKKKLNFRQIKSRLNESNIILIKKSLDTLEKQGVLKQVNPGSYVLNQKKTVSGIIDKTKKGSGYLIVENNEKDFFISEKNINKALNGDTVECVKITNREVKVIKIVKRKKQRYVGVVFTENNQKFIDYNSNKDKVVFLCRDNSIKNNDIVVFEIFKWENNIPEANALKALGEKGNVNNEIHAILEEFELPYEFDNNLIKEAELLKDFQNKKEDLKRKCFKNIITFTIDPADAKDFDDAISVNKINNETIEIGVHIADVSHFLKENTILDKEAEKRATSVYLVDRVVSMLPEEISNNLCSLNPREDKYAFSAVFTFKNDVIIKEWFGKTVINSNERLSYKEAQFVIDNKKRTIPLSVSLNGKTKEINKEIEEGIYVINKLAKKLREERHNKGSISFNKKEVKFVLNKEKEPIKTIIKESLAANKLIEEFMLLANKKVASLFIKHKKGLFRIHDYPDDQKIIILEKIIKKLGYKLSLRDSKNINNQLNLLLKQTENTPEKNLIDTLVIRSMSKAKYSTKNIGHFGLSFDKYTHFTSPIRRYPDVLVHRELERILSNNKKDQNLEKLCLHCSSREEIATKAERASIKFMQVKFMSKNINKSYEGVISGIMERGIFVEATENKCEGFIRIKDIPGDYFSFLENEMLLLGRHTKEEYRLGDKVLIKVLAVNQSKKQIDFSLIEKM